MYINSSKAVAFIPSDPIAVLPVRYQDDSIAFDVRSAAAMTLAKLGFVEGFLYKRKLTWLRLTVSPAQVAHLLKPFNGKRGATRLTKKNPMGWVERLDRAAGGQTGAHRELAFPLNHENRIIGAGERETPHAQNETTN